MPRSRPAGGPTLRLLACLLGTLLALACSGGLTGPAAEPEPFPAFASAGPHATSIGTQGECTVFRPAALGAEGVRHPVILWGNGTNTSAMTYAGLLGHLASHGFIVVAPNTPNAGDGTQMTAGLDLLAVQDGTPGSVFFRRVDLARVGASGHSQGGAGAIMAGRDPRVGTTAPLQPYILPILGGGPFQAASIGQQQGPMLLLSGGLDATAAPERHQRPVYEGMNRPVVWATRAGADHLAPFGDGGAFRGPLTAWFRARLMDDAEAARLFPSSCTLCAAPGWSVRSR